MKKLILASIVTVLFFSCALGPGSVKELVEVSKSDSDALYSILNDSAIETLMLVEQGAARQVINDLTDGRTAVQQEGWVVKGDDGYFTLVEEAVPGQPSARRFIQTFVGYKKSGVTVAGSAVITLTLSGEGLYESCYTGKVTVTTLESKQCCWELKLSADLNSMTFTVEGHVGGYKVAYN